MQISNDMLSTPMSWGTLLFTLDMIMRSLKDNSTSLIFWRPLLADRVLLLSANAGDAQCDVANREAFHPGAAADDRT